MDGFPRGQQVSDVFLNYPNVKTTSIKRFKSGNVRDFKPSGLMSSLSYSFEHIDYFIFPTEIKINIQNSQKIENLSGRLWNVFENEDNQIIPEFSYTTATPNKNNFRQWVKERFG